MGGNGTESVHAFGVKGDMAFLDWPFHLNNKFSFIMLTSTKRKCTARGSYLPFALL